MTVGPFRDLGPAIVNFKTFDIGPTHGGVTHRDTEGSEKVYEDQNGVTCVDVITTGHVMEVETPFTRVTLANYAAIIGGASVVGSTVIVSNTNVGSSMKANAGVLILKPVVDGVADAVENNWLKYFSAAPRADHEVGFAPDGQRVYKTIWEIFPDGTGRLYARGNVT